MFSSSDDDDSDNLFDLQTKKLSSEGYFESFQQDRKLEDPQQQQDVKDRSEEYLTGSLGADSRTHYDLSKAGLGNLEEGVWGVWVCVWGGWVCKGCVLGLGV